MFAGRSLKRLRRGSTRATRSDTEFRSPQRWQRVSHRPNRLFHTGECKFQFRVRSGRWWCLVVTALQPPFHRVRSESTTKNEQFGSVGTERPRTGSGGGVNRVIYRDSSRIVRPLSLDRWERPKRAGSRDRLAPVCLIFALSNCWLLSAAQIARGLPGWWVAI